MASAGRTEGIAEIARIGVLRAYEQEERISSLRLGMR
jgi:hypothetical protein